MPRTHDIAALVDRQPFGAFHARVVGLIFLLMLADGYDNISIAYIAPLLVREWGIDKAALGPLFGAGLLGGLFGPPLFGALADRYGRKPAVIGGAFFFGLFTLAQASAASMPAMMLLRFVAGIGIGGVLPIAIALNTEFAPRRIRATLTMIGFVGVALGGALGGAVSSALMGSHGWPVVLWIGGIAPLAIGALALPALPESPKFLVLKPARRAQLVAVMGRLAPGFAAQDDDRFVLGDETNRAGFAFGDLFAGRLKAMTPLVWAVNLVSLLVFFLVNQWMPVLLTSAGMAAERAALSTTVFMLGGFVGVLAILRAVDRFGMAPVPVLFALGIPAVALIGVPGLGAVAVLALAGAAGFSLIALQFGIIATESQIYPTGIRSWAVGACFALGRVGSVIGPLAAGAMLSRGVSVQYLFFFAAALMVLGLAASLKLTPMYRRRLAELPPAAPPDPAPDGAPAGTPPGPSPLLEH